MRFYAIACPIVWQYTLDMQCSSLETLVISESTHVRVVTLKCDSRVPPRLLHNPNSKHRECKDDKYTDPGSVCCEGSFGVGVRKQVVEHVHVVLQMVAGLGDVDWAVLTIEQVLLIKVLQPLLFVFALTHKMKRVVLVIKIGRILREH